VRKLLRQIAELAPPPRPQPVEPRPISSQEPQVTGFVFEVQANIDPQHSDRSAFAHVASDRFHCRMKSKNIHT